MSSPRHGPARQTITDPSLATKILRNRTLTVTNLGPHLDQLAEATGEDFSVLKQVIRSSLIYQVGSEHLQTRRILAQFFGEKSIADWSDMFDAEIASRIAGLEASEKPDLVRDFTDPLFVGIVGKLVGLRMAPDVDLIGLVDRTRLLTEPLLSLRQIRSMQAALGDIMALIPAEGFDPTARPRPLAQVVAEDRPPVPQGVSITATIAALVIAAHTMAESLAFALWGLLSREPACWADAATDDWRDRELERLLSRYPSTLFLYRVAGEDGNIGGCPVHAGQTLALDMPAVNSHIRADVAGGEGRHGTCLLTAGQTMAFGTGPHKCPGEALARLVIGRAVPALARAFPRLTLLRDQVRFFRTEVVQTPSALPCDLRACSAKVGSKLWQVKDPVAARRIVTDDEAFGPPEMIDHLTALAQSGKLDLDVAICMARNAMFFLSGARHDATRRMVSQALGGNRIAAWEPYIADQVEQALDGLAHARKPDLVTDFSEPLCRAVNKQVLGLHPADHGRFDELAPEFHRLLEPMLSVREILDLQAVMAETLALVRNGQTETDGTATPRGLLQTLLDEQHPGFGPDDCRALALILYGAGFNMTHTLSNALHWILTLPAEERAAGVDTGWVVPKIETMIGLLGAPKYIYRMARHAVEVDGMRFAARDTAQIHLAQVNRASTAGHLSFGHGLHHCVGAALTRLTLRVAIPKLFQRYPTLRLEPQAHAYCDFSQTVALKSLKCISVQVL
ncbi:MAG: cytochrome P450 [Alphaproteobacteria bacterium]|nr:MAG: cytochrome P450 [Alphaproteobacteria bacterium]